MSEAHFLHGDPELYSIVEGFHPDEEEHASYVVVDPLTGAPLSGAKQMQLNMMLQQEPLDLLANVSQGVFPLVRAKEVRSFFEFEFEFEFYKTEERS